MKSKSEIRAAILKQSGSRSGRQVLDAIQWEEMSDNIGNALKALLAGQAQLRDAYRSHLADSGNEKSGKLMTFALDGRLVGDIGELIAAEVFCLKLLGTKSRDIDAIATDGSDRKVQDKATFRADGLSIKHNGDYFVGLQLNDGGKFRVIYNGPARSVVEYLKAPKAEGHSGRKSAGRALEPLSLEAWAVLDLAVQDADRIPRHPQARNQH